MSDLHSRRQELVLKAIERSRMKEQTKRREEWDREVPDRFKGFTYNDIIGKDSALSNEVKRLLKSFMKQDGGFLVMQGPTGTGKTTTACAVVQELLDRYVEENKPLPGAGQARFYSSSDLLWRLSNMNYRSDNNMEKTNARVENAPFLIVDDIGAGNTGVSEHQERVLWGLLNSRYNHPEKVTIITTNMPIIGDGEGYGLREWMGESMWDRISSTMTKIVFRGESLRRRN